MKVLNIKVEEFKDIVLELVSTYQELVGDPQLKEKITGDLESITNRLHPLTGYDMGISDSQELHLGYNYHVVMGEIMLMLRNNRFDEELEWVFLSGLDKRLDPHVIIEPYL